MVLVQGPNSSRYENWMAFFQSLRPVPAGRLKRSIRRGSLAGDTEGDRRDKLHFASVVQGRTFVTNT